MDAQRDDSSAPKRATLTLDRFDRRVGDGIRRVIRDLRLAPVAAIAAAMLGPGFRILVAAWFIRGPRRRVGAEAIASAVTAAQIARLARDRIGRTRPGVRTDGGMPSRHAAAAIAIVQSAQRHDRHGRTLGSLAAIGLVGRIANASHEPLDIAAGAALGNIVERIVALLGRIVTNDR